MTARVPAATYRGVNALVLGGTGFVGRWVARELALRGARVTIAVRDPAAAARICSRYAIRCATRAIDLENPEAAIELVHSVRPAITFNLVGYGVDRSERDEKTAERVNTLLPEALCDAVARHRDLNWSRQALIHAGTAAEYGAVRGNLQEDSKESPTTLYGNSKLFGTRLLIKRASTSHMRAIVARLFTLYGPGEHAGRLLPSLIESARREGTIPLTEGLQRRDFTYIDDAVEGLLRLGLCDAEAAQVVNVSTGRLVAVRDFVVAAAGVLGIDPARLAFGALPTRPEEMEHADVSIARLRGLVQWVPRTSMRDGVRKTLEFGDEDAA